MAATWRRPGDDRRMTKWNFHPSPWWLLVAPSRQSSPACCACAPICTPMRTVAFVRGADRGDEHDQDMSLRPPENTLYQSNPP